MQQQLLSCNDFALKLCASLQPNSRLWQTETGTTLRGGNGVSAAPLGTLLLDAPVCAARGVVRPIDTTAMDSLYGTGITGTLATAAAHGMRGFAKYDGIMHKEERPAAPDMRISDNNTGSSGTIDNLKKLITGSHSRPGGLPPLIEAHAPPGRASADPGGGPTAS